VPGCREIVVRRPHEFKIACLQDIRALFPAQWNPFYAGFGNRDTDEVAYNEVGGGFGQGGGWVGGSGEACREGGEGRHASAGFGTGNTWCVRLAG
jgi:hypothetical protein